MAMEFASPPVLANLTISAQGLSSINLSARYTSSGQLRVDKLPDSIVFETALSTAELA